MIRQGILAFEERPTTLRLTAQRVAALSLLDRGIRTLARAGIERLTVVVPAQAPLPISSLTRRLGLAIEFCSWDEVALALPPGEGVLILLGDHVHHHTSLARLIEEGLDSNEVVAQTSVPPAGDGPFWTVEATSSSLTFVPTSTFSANVSTGAFLCASELLSGVSLRAARADFRAFLQSLAAGRRSATRFLPVPLWQPVSDRRSARAAKAMLFSQVTKSTSGYISRHLNARISIPISKVLIETGISPHLVTVLLVLTTGLTSAYLVTQADEYPKLALAGLLWQLAAILDRCDGEIARVKLCESKFGAWFDTVTDNLAYLCAYIGLLFGMQRLHPNVHFYWYFGLSGVAALLLTLAIMYTYARRSGSGSLQHYLRDLACNLPDGEKGWIQRLTQRCGFIAKRDFLSFLLCIAALLNALEVAYWALVVLLHLAAGAVVLSQRKMLQKVKRLASGEMATPSLEERR